MERLGDTWLQLHLTLDLDGDIERQFGQADSTACVRSDLRPKRTEYEIGEAVDDIRLTNEARRRVDHSENAAPTRDALQASELALETSENSEAGQARSYVGLLLGHVSTDLAQGQSERAIGVSWAMPGEDCPTAHDAHPGEGQRYAWRQLQRLWQDQAQRADPIFNDGHSMASIRIGVA